MKLTIESIQNAMANTYPAKGDEFWLDPKRREGPDRRGGYEAGLPETNLTYADRLDPGGRMNTSKPFEATEKLFEIVGRLRTVAFGSTAQAEEAFQAYKGAKTEIDNIKHAIAEVVKLMRNEYPEDCMGRVADLLPFAE